MHAKLHCELREFLALFPANHAQGVVGRLVRALTYLCEIAGITPIVAGREGQERIAPIWERVK